jgi:hypothetical protein
MRTLGSLKPGDRCGALRVTPVGHQRRHCGEIRFRPATGNGGTRGIEAMIDRDGVPQPHRELATYKVPPAPLPARPSRVTVRRTTGNRVVVGVTASAGSARTSVRVDVQDGRRLSFERRSQRRFGIVIRDVSRRFGVAVVARGIRRDLRLGAARRLTLHGGEKAVPAPPSKRASRRTR